MPAPWASTPFLPNLNQHVDLEPLEGPIILEVRLCDPTLLRVPRNREAKFEAETWGEEKALLSLEVMGWWVMHEIEAIVVEL